jgi:hypothetical protein
MRGFWTVNFPDPGHSAESPLRLVMSFDTICVRNGAPLINTTG